MPTADLPVPPLAVTLGTSLLAAIALGALEAARPLRPRVEPWGRHVARNLATYALAQAVATPLRLLIVLPLAALVRERGWGLLGLAEMPLAARALLGIALLDGTLWIWHLLNHRVHLLWRFHAAHHADLDIDASSALRFHFGELSLSVLWRALQVLALGTGPGVLATWELLTLLATLFHHSNLRLPEALDRAIARVLPTPRMHGIHHSVVRQERDTNYGVLTSLWDRLAGTFLIDVPQERVIIGIPAVREPEQARFGHVQALPFRIR